MTNSSREVSRNDRWTQVAKEQDEYWLCECGVARVDADALYKHCTKQNHFAEHIDTENGVVIGFMAGDIDHEKYTASIPQSAQLDREKRKNDPFFPRYNE